MFEKLTSRVLGHFVGQYVTGNGLSPDHIHLQIARGDLTLEDVELNSHKLANDLAVYLDLIGSIQLLKSNAKKLEVKVPWSQLLGEGKPTVTLDSPEIVIKQSKGSQVDIEAHRKRALMNSSVPATSHGIAQNMAQYAGNQLVKRLEILIRNLKVRIEVEGYEMRGSQAVKEGDEVGSLPPACAFELEVGSILISPDEASVFDSSERSVTIDNLTVKWIRTNPDGSFGDPRIILGPTNTKVLSASSHKNQALEIVFEALKSTLNDSTYSDIMLMLDNFTTPPLKFKDIRPQEALKGSNSIRKWWGYAIEAARKMTREKKEAWKWEKLKGRFEKRREYISLWLYALQTPLSKPEQEELEEIEQTLSVEDITVYRALAEAAYKWKITSEEQSSGVLSSITSLISSRPTPERRTLDFQELKALYAEIGYGHTITKQDQLKIDMRFSRIGLDLEEDELDESGNSKKIVETELLGLSTQFHAVDRHRLFSFGVDSLSCLDHFTNKNCPFQLIRAQLTPTHLDPVKAKEEREEHVVIDKEEVKEKNLDRYQSRLAAINFEMNAPEVDYRASIILEPIHFTVLQPTINRLKKLFLAPFLQPGLEDLQRELEEQYEQIKREAETQIKYAINQAKTLDINTSIRAPTITFPESYCCTKNVPKLTLDLGSVIVKTDLQSREAAKSFTSEGNASISDAYFFDKFVVLFSSINMHLQTFDEEKIRLLDSFDLQVSADRSRVTNSSLPLLKLKADAPPISLKMSPTHLATVIRILNSHLSESDKLNSKMREIKENKPPVFVEPLESAPVEIKVRTQDQCIVTADLTFKELSISLIDQLDKVTVQLALQEVLGTLRQSHRRVTFNLTAGDFKIWNALTEGLPEDEEQDSWVSIPKKEGSEAPIFSLRFLSFLEDMPSTTPKNQIDVEMDSLRLVFSDRFLVSVLDMKETITNWKSSIGEETEEEGEDWSTSTQRVVQKEIPVEEVQEKVKSLMKMTLKMNQLHISLHDKGRVIGRIEVKQPHIAALLNGEKAVKCKFSSLTLRNQMPGVLSSEWETALFLDGEESMISYTTLPRIENSTSGPSESSCIQLDFGKVQGVYLDQVANYFIEYFDGIVHVISSYEEKTEPPGTKDDSWTRLKIQIREGSVILPESATSSNHFRLDGISWSIANQREFMITESERESTVVKVESIRMFASNNSVVSELLRNPIPGSLTIDSFTFSDGRKSPTDVSLFFTTPNIIMGETDFALLISTIMTGNLATKKDAKQEKSQSSHSLMDHAVGQSLMEEFSSTLQTDIERQDLGVEKKSLPGSSRPNLSAPPNDTTVSLKFSSFDLTLVGYFSPSPDLIKQEQFARIHLEGAELRWELNGTDDSTIFTTCINQAALFDELNSLDKEGLLFITPEEDSDEDAVRVRCCTKRKVPEEGKKNPGGVAQSNNYTIETGDVNLQFYPDLLDKFPHYVKSLVQTIDRYTKKEEASPSPEVVGTEEETQIIGFTANKLRLFTLKEKNSSKGFAFSCIPRIDLVISLGIVKQFSLATIECGLYRYNYAQYFDISAESASSFANATLVEIPTLSTPSSASAGRSLLRGTKLGVIPHEGLINPFEIGFQYASEKHEKYVLVVSAVTGTVSYRDLALFQSIGSAWQLSFTKFAEPFMTSPPSFESASQPSFIDKLLSRTPSEKQEALSIRCRDIELWITDDSNTVTELPLLAFTLRGTELNLYNWSSIINGDFAIEPSAMYYNSRVEAWEPLLDHVILKCLVTSKMNGAYGMNVHINGGKVELTLSEAFLGLAFRLEQMWMKASEIENSHPSSQRSLYYIRNQTGTTLEFWIPQLKSPVTLVENDQEVPLDILDNKLGVNRDKASRRLPRREDYTVTIQVGSALPIEGIPLLGHGKHLYELVSKKETSHLICEVLSEDNSRILVLRSHIEIVNQCNEPVRVVFESRPHTSTKWPSLELVNLEPRSSCPVPIKFVKDGSFRVGPVAEKGFNMSNSSLNYNDLQGEESVHFLNCLPMSPTAPIPPIAKEKEPLLILTQDKESKQPKSEHQEDDNWLFKAEVRRENVLPPRSYSLQEHELYSIHLHPALVLENTLLVPLTFRAVDLVTGSVLLFETVNIGCLAQVHRLPPSQNLGISVLIPGYNWSKPVDILKLNPQKVTQVLVDGINDSSMKMALQLSQIDGRRGVVNLVFWSKYWVVNRTSTKLNLTTSGVYLPKRVFVVKPSEDPVTFGPKDKRDILNIQTEHSYWSDSIDLGAQNMVGYVEAIENAEPPENRQVFEIGVDISPAPDQYWRTKVITFTPRYVVKNCWNCNLYFRQKGDSREVEIDPHQTGSFNWPSTVCEKKLQMRMMGSNNWSGFFSLEDLGDLILALKDSYNEINYFEIRTLINGSTLQVDISKREQPEYLLKNDSPVTLFVSQLSSPSENIKEGIPRPTKALPVSILNSQLVQPFSEIPFCWEDPSSVRRLRIQYGGPTSPISKEYVLDTLREYPIVEVPTSPLLVEDKNMMSTEKKSLSTLTSSQREEESTQLLGSKSAEKVSSTPSSTSSISTVPSSPSIKVRTSMESLEGNVKVLKIETLNTEKEVVPLSEVEEEAGEMEPKSRNDSRGGRRRRRRSHNTPRVRCRITLQAIGLSFVDRTPQEVFYLVLQNLNIVTEVTKNNFSLEASVSRVEVDNELDSPYPVALRSLPTSSLELSTTSTHLSSSSSSSSAAAGETPTPHFIPAFQLGLLTSRALNKKDFLAFNYFAAQLQQIDIAIDEIFLVKMMDIQKRFQEDLRKRKLNIKKRKASSSSSSSSPLKSQSLELTGSSALHSRQEITKVLKARSGTIPISKNGLSNLRLYFEMLHLNPIQANVSFMSVPEASEGSETEANAFERWLSVVGTLTDVENAPIRLNGLILENPLVTLPELKNNIGEHYKNQLLRQVYKIVGNANFLGSPATFFGHLGTGFYDFFHEPAHSIVHHPEDILSSLAKGTSSLFSSTVYSFADSAHRFGQTITKAATRISQDESWRRERGQRARTKPETAMEGTLEGIKDLGKGFLHGLKGIWKDPQREVAKDKSITGLAKGAYKGIAGAVLKPAIGVGDLMTRTAEGVKNATGPGAGGSSGLPNSSDSFLSGRIRPPRPVSEEGVIIPLPTNELPLELLWPSDTSSYSSSSYSSSSYYGGSYGSSFSSHLPSSEADETASHSGEPSATTS